MQELAQAIDRGDDHTNIRNLWVKENGNIFKNEIRPLIENLDSIPTFDHNLYYKYSHLRNKPYKYFFSGRGCPYRCSFCFNHSMAKIYKNKGRYIRHRKPESIIEELKHVRSFALKVVCFADDVFIINQKWLTYFLELYKKEINLPFRCNIFATLVNEETISALKDAGCHYVMFGVESGNEKIRECILNKKISNDDIYRCTQLLHKYKIPFSTSNMFGFPGETIDDAFETIKLNARIRPHTSWASVFQPYPKLAITDYAVKNNYLDIQDLKHNSYDSFRNSPIKGKDVKRIFNLHKFSLIAIKFPSLLPLIRQLIKLPPNSLYYYIFAFSYGLHYWKRTGYDFFGMLREGTFIIKNRFSLFKGKR